MKKVLSFLLLSISIFSLYADDDDGYQVDFFMMNQEIKSTVEENQRQKKMKSNENKNLSLETGNNEIWKSIKTSVTKIQDRLSIVDFALQGIPAGVVMLRKSKSIKRNQQQIFDEVQSLPADITPVLMRQITFVEDFKMVSQYIFGLVVSYGVINQMERAERKILLDYALEEVNRLEMNSFYTLSLIREAKMRIAMKQAEIDFYVNRDKSLVKDIINNVKSF